MNRGKANTDASLGKNLVGGCNQIKYCKRTLLKSTWFMQVLLQ